MTPKSVSSNSRALHDLPLVLAHMNQVAFGLYDPREGLGELIKRDDWVIGCKMPIEILDRLHVIWCRTPDHGIAHAGLSYGFARCRTLERRYGLCDVAKT